MTRRQAMIIGMRCFILVGVSAWLISDKLTGRKKFLM